MNTRGIALILVLAFILAIVVIANIALFIMSSQTRFTQHQVERIRVYYAAQAGINYALEQLRTGVWGAGAYTLGTCDPGPCDVPDLDIPFQVNITIGAPVGGIRQVDARATN